MLGPANIVRNRISIDQLPTIPTVRSADKIAFTLACRSAKLLLTAGTRLAATSSRSASALAGESVGAAIEVIVLLAVPTLPAKSAIEKPAFQYHRLSCASLYLNGASVLNNESIAALSTIDLGCVGHLILL
jgi:hypothetical protein